MARERAKQGGCLMKGRRIGRRLLCLALAMLLLALTFAPAYAESKPAGGYIVAVSKGSHLNVRYGPGTGYGVKMKLPRGAVVVYQSQTKGWWYVMYAGGAGYVDGKYLWSVDWSPKAKYVAVANLYVRYGPSTSYWAMGKMTKGKQQVTIVKQNGTWSLINYKGHTGWAATKYLFRVS